jgi:hypothetical protein
MASAGKAGFRRAPELAREKNMGVKFLSGSR